jgi:tetratricopeptide (TPR) repeat protein
LESAQRDLERALEITGENAVLFFQLAHVHYQFWNAGIRLEEEDLRLAREYADRALVLDPHSPDHLGIRGLLEVTGGNAVRGLAYFEAALDCDATNADVLAWYPGIAGFMGLEVEANERLEQLWRIDPLNSFGLVIPIFVDINVGRFASALDQALRSREARPGERLVEGGYAYALALNGRPREAVVVIREYFGSEQDMLARIYSALGCAFEHDRDGVLRILDRDFERWAEKDFQYSEWVAQALALVDECEGALDWLENSVERGNINYPYLSEHDPFLAKLRGQPRYAALMKRVKHEWERFKSGERQTLSSSNV